MSPRAVSIPIVGDLTPEQTETFRLLLTGALNAQLLDASGRGEIVDRLITGRPPTRLATSLRV